MKLVKVYLDEIQPYENNPRYNDDAVQAVKESIKQCGYCSPIVIDEHYVILSGHTRHRALYELNVEEAECIIVEGLTEEQKKKFRLLDNKTAEIADWDYDMLIAELDGLDLGDFTYFEKEVEKMADKMIKEHETGKAAEAVEDKIIYCPRCGKPINGFNIEGLEDE